jgi:hypothetical protein
MRLTKKTQKGGVKRNNRLKLKKQKKKLLLTRRKTMVKPQVFKPQPANNSAFNDLVANMTKAKVANKGNSQEYYPYAPPGYIGGIGTPPENKRYGKKIMHAAENAEDKPFDPENYGPPKGQYAVGK